MTLRTNTTVLPDPELEPSEIMAMWLTLAFYAGPETYHACAFAFDPPCGEFNTDFSYDEEYGRPMPGKRARELLDKLQAKVAALRGETLTVTEDEPLQTPPLV